MKPRQRTGAGGIPQRLAEFTETDWPGVDWRARYDAWRDAQNNHAAEYGWPAGPLDVVFRRMLARSRYHGTPLHLGVTDWFGLPPERERPARRRLAPVLRRR